MEGKKFGQQNVDYLIKKFKTLGFEGLALQDLAVAVILPEFNTQFLRQFGIDWSTKYEPRALEKLNKAQFDMQWMIQQEKKLDQLKPLFEATEKGEIQKVKLFLQKNENQDNVRFAVNEHSKTLLHVACESGQTVLVEFYLMQGHNPNARDRLLQTPLHLACYKGYEKVADLLIQYKANIYAQDGHGRGVLHYACSSISAQLVHLLIGYEPGLVKMKDNNELSVLHYAILNSSSKQIDMIRTLIEHGVDVNGRDDQGKTALYYACELGKTRVIPILVQKGSDPSIPDLKNQKTALDVAANERTRELLIVYMNRQINGNPKEEDLAWMNQAIKGEPVDKGAKKYLFAPPQTDLDQTQKIVTGGKKGVANTQKDQTKQENNKQENTKFVKEEQKKVTMSNLSRERFFHMMKKIQDEGVRVFQHIKKPFIYSGSWMEGINSLDDLYELFSEITPTEACLLTFNILCPYDKELPQDPSQEMVAKMYGDPWKSAIEKPLEEKKERERKIQAQLGQVDNLKFQLELKEQRLNERIEENKSLLIQIELLKEKLKMYSGPAQVIPEEATQQIKDLQQEIYMLRESNKSLQEKSRLKDEEIKSLREEIKSVKGEVKTKPTIQENLWDDESIINMLMALKNNPPGMVKRLQGVDGDKDGKVLRSEFQTFCKQLGLSDEDFEALCRICKFSETNKLLVISEFKAILENRPKERQEAEEKLFKRILDGFKVRSLSLEEAFNRLDADKSGQVDFEELKEGLRKMKIELDHKDISNIFAIFDRDRSGSITLAEMNGVLTEMQIKLMDKYQNDMEQIWQKENLEFDEEKNLKIKKDQLYTGKLRVQIPHIRKLLPPEALDKEIVLEISIEGHDEKFKQSVFSDKQGNLLLMFSFKFVNINPSRDLSDFIDIKIWSQQSGFEEFYLGEIKVSWKVCIPSPNTWRISREFTMVNSSYPKKKVGGFLAFQSRWEDVDEYDNQPQILKAPEYVFPEEKIKKTKKNNKTIKQKINQALRDRNKIHLDDSGYEDVLDIDELSNINQINDIDSNIEGYDSNTSNYVLEKDRIALQQNSQFQGMDSNVDSNV